MKTNRILSVLFYGLLGSLIALALGFYSPLAAIIGAGCGQFLSYFGIAEGILALNLPTTIKEAREQRAKLEADMKAWHERVKAGEGMKDEDWTKWDEMRSDSNALKEHLARLESIEDFQKKQAEEIHQQQHVEIKTEATKEEREKAFSRFLRVGMGRLSDKEREIMNKISTEIDDPNVRAVLGTTSGAVGGYLIPEGFSNALEQAMLPYMAGLQEFTTLETATGNDLPWPTLNDTSNEGEQLDEGSEVTETEPTFGSQTLKAFTFDSKLIGVYVTLLQDSAFNLDALIQAIAGERLGRILNKKFTTGGGTTTIEGILTGATNSGISSVSASALTRDNIVDLMYSVNGDYRARGMFMMADATEKAIRKLAFGTSDDRPIWQGGNITQGLPDTIEGKRYVVNYQMDGPAAGKNSILFGDLKKYIVRKVKGYTLVVFREKYMHKLQVCYLIYCRYDGQLLDAGTNPVKYIAHPLT